MRSCPKCFQTFTDDNSYCLSDGTPLVYLLDNSSQPTIIGNSPIVFPTPNHSQLTANTQQGFNPAYAVIALLALIVVGLTAYLFLRESKDTIITKTENTNTNINTNTATNFREQISNLEQEKMDQEKANLQLQKEKIELEKQKLNREKNKLNQQKNEVQPSNSSNVAYVFFPPSNVREIASGEILCIVRQKRNIQITGSVSESNGIWYYTNVCGTIGAIHESQIKF